jgi:GGDEF domain-containing protein
MMKVDALVVEGFILIGAVLYLSRIVWHQRRAIEALQADRLAIENRLGTIQQQTCFDALTGLRNQQMFEIRVSSLLRGTVPFVLIYIDLDGLKAINDRLGHPSGRSLIRSAVKAIRSAVNRLHDLDTLFRRSRAADEFLWILEGSRIDIGTRASPANPDSASIGRCVRFDRRDGVGCLRQSGNRVCAQAVAEHTAPAALPRDTRSPFPKRFLTKSRSRSKRSRTKSRSPFPKRFRTKSESVNDTERVEVTERHAA